MYVVITVVYITVCFCFRLTGDLGELEGLDLHPAVLSGDYGCIMEKDL